LHHGGDGSKPCIADTDEAQSPESHRRGESLPRPDRQERLAGCARMQVRAALRPAEHRRHLCLVAAKWPPPRRHRAGEPGQSLPRDPDPPRLRRLASAARIARASRDREVPPRTCTSGRDVTLKRSSANGLGARRLVRVAGGTHAATTNRGRKTRAHRSAQLWWGACRQGVAGDRRRGEQAEGGRASCSASPRVPKRVRGKANDPSQFSTGRTPTGC
jgi:hypothetical protein